MQLKDIKYKLNNMKYVTIMGELMEIMGDLNDDEIAQVQSQFKNIMKQNARFDTIDDVIQKSYNKLQKKNERQQAKQQQQQAKQQKQPQQQAKQQDPKKLLQKYYRTLGI